MTPAEWLPAEEKCLMQVREQGACEPFEKEYGRKDGTRVPVLITKVMMPGDGGEILTIVVNMTERRRAENALRLSEEKFATAFASNPAAVALSRLDDGVLIDVNDTWVEMNGWSREEAVGRSARRDAHVAYAGVIGTVQVKELREKGQVRGWEQEFLKKSGESFVAQISAQALTMRGEKLILSTLVDITERKRAEEALKKAHDELERRVAERTAELTTMVEALRDEVGRRMKVEGDLRERGDQLRMLAQELTLAEQQERRRLAHVLHDHLPRR